MYILVDRKNIAYLSTISFKLWSIGRATFVPLQCSTFECLVKHRWKFLFFLALRTLSYTFRFNLFGRSFIHFHTFIVDNTVNEKETGEAISIIVKVPSHRWDGKDTTRSIFPSGANVLLYAAALQNAVGCRWLPAWLTTGWVYGYTLAKEHNRR